MVYDGSYGDGYGNKQYHYPVLPNMLVSSCDHVN